MKTKKCKSITEIFLDGKPVDEAMRMAAQEAMRRHKAAGQPIVVWRNGKTVEIPASKIRIVRRSRKRS